MPTNNDDDESSSSSSSYDEEEEDDLELLDEDEDDDDEDEDDSPLAFHSICTGGRSGSESTSFPTLQEALEHDKREYGFDLVGLLASAGGGGDYDEEKEEEKEDEDEDDEGGDEFNDDDDDEDDDDDLLSILVVNLCREFVSSSTPSLNKEELGSALTSHVRKALLGKEGGGLDERYYRPVLEDDAVLMHTDELAGLVRGRRSTRRRRRRRQGSRSRRVDNAGEEGSAEKGRTNGDGDGRGRIHVEGGGGGEASIRGTSSFTPVSPTAAAAEAEALSARMAALEDQLSKAKACIASLTTEPGDDRAALRRRRRLGQDNDTYYFSSYSTSHIHETMLRDSVRTDSYRRAILDNSDALFKDKVVLDVGCGTGVLSIFAARAGARKVVAVDASDVIKEARQIVDGNGYGKVIEFANGKLEDLLKEGKLPLDQGEKVDVIVSEWMGYALLFETMLPSVLAARDAIMKSPSLDHGGGVGGTMWPSRSSIFLEGATDDRLSYWDDVYGINMSAMKDRVVRELVDDAGVEVVEDKNVVTDRAELIEFDLNHCKDGDLDFESEFELRPRKKKDDNDAEDDDAAVEIQKLVVSFDIFFSLPHVPNTNAVSFSTGCQSQPTHWKQTVLWFDPSCGMGFPSLAKGEVMRGKLKMGRNEQNPREMDFRIRWEVGRWEEESEEGGGEGNEKKRTFRRRTEGSLRTKLGA